MSLYKVQIYLFFLIVLCFGCSDSEKGHIPDVSGIDIEVQIERFDQDLHQLGQPSPWVWSQQMEKKYGQFYVDFLDYMLEVGRVDDSVRVTSVLPQIAQSTGFVDLSKEVDSVFSAKDFKRYEAQLTQSFKLINYYIPTFVAPRVISFYSGFAVQVAVGEGYVGIGLDMFLGENSKFYPALIESIPRYMSKRYTPENMVPRVLESMIRMDVLPEGDAQHTMLEHMIYHGKVLYAMDAFLPETADSLKIGYTAKQMEWARTYEQDIYTYFVGENLLFSTDRKSVV